MNKLSPSRDLNLRPQEYNVGILPTERDIQQLKFLPSSTLLEFESSKSTTKCANKRKLETHDMHFLPISTDYRSSGMRSHIVFYTVINISEEPAACIFWAEE
jgi:hypothetical protein